MNNASGLGAKGMLSLVLMVVIYIAMIALSVLAAISAFNSDEERRTRWVSEYPEDYVISKTYHVDQFNTGNNYKAYEIEYDSEDDIESTHGSRMIFAVGIMFGFGWFAQFCFFFGCYDAEIKTTTTRTVSKGSDGSKCILKM